MKIKPAIRGPKNYCDYSELAIGDTFIYHGALWIKSDDTGSFEQTAINLATGEWDYNLCGIQVFPVDAVITWTKQKE
jgi:hypothetical protein